MTLVGVMMIVVLLAAMAFAWMVARLVRPKDEGAASLEWLDEFSMDKYVPMERLLSGGDYDFLSRQRGYDPAIARRLRNERKRLFRDYLHQLRIDFHRLVSLADIMIVHSHEDRADLASEVWRQRMVFYRTLTAVEIRFLLAPLGASMSGLKDVITALESMRLCVNDLTPAALHAAA